MLKAVTTLSKVATDSDVNITINFLVVYPYLTSGPCSRSADTIPQQLHYNQMVNTKSSSPADFTCREQTFHSMNNMTVSFAIAKAARDTSAVLQMSAWTLDSVIPF